MIDMSWTTEGAETSQIELSFKHMPRMTTCELFQYSGLLTLAHILTNFVILPRSSVLTLSFTFGAT